MTTSGKAPILALHGSAETPAQWDLLAGGDGRTVATPDLHVLRSRASPDDRLLGSLSRLGASLLQAYGGGAARLHLVGHGFGGALALRLALQRPERVASLSLIDPLPLHLLRFGGLADRLAFGDTLYAMTDVLKAVGRRTRSVGMARYVDYWYGEGTWRALPEPERERIAARAHHVVDDVTETLRATERLDPYRRLETPTVVLCGRRSATATRRAAALVAGLLPAARLHPIPGAAHAAPVTHAEAVRALVLAHADAHEPGAATALAA